MAKTLQEILSPNPVFIKDLVEKLYKKEKRTIDSYKNLCYTKVPNYEIFYKELNYQRVYQSFLKLEEVEYKIGPEFLDEEEIKKYAVELNRKLFKILVENYSTDQTFRK